MSYKLERSRQARSNLQSILLFPARSHIAFGDDLVTAKKRAVDRLKRIRAAMNALSLKPQQGTRRDDLKPGLRCVTKERAIFYFEIDENRRLVRILAVFFGGQDHQRQMLKRLLRD